MKISTEYLKNLLWCYEKSFETRQKIIKKLEKDEEKTGELKVLQDAQIEAKGKMNLCNWLIEMSEIPEEVE